MKHRVANIIRSTKKGVGNIGEGKEIVDEAIKFFSSILSKELNLGEDQKVNLNTIPRVLTATQNNFLVAILGLEEIKEAIFTLLGEKAPSLDGFPNFFFSIHNGKLLKMTLLKWFKNFLQLGIFLRR